MASIADQLVKNQHVISELNLFCFGIWTSEASEDELDEVMQVIYTEEHRLREDWGLFPTEPLVITRVDLGRSWTLRKKLCDEEDCLRCIGGIGGWQFRWVGPWTCPNIVGDEHTSLQEVLQRAIKWECGLH